MAIPRKQLISLTDTPYYHIVSRCVRRAWLCGKDPYTDKDYSYRRAWFVGRLRELVTVFSIDVASYAVMSNHTHLVLHVDEQQSKDWSTPEVITRWHSIYRGNLLHSASKLATPSPQRSSPYWRQKSNSGANACTASRGLCLR